MYRKTVMVLSSTISTSVSDFWVNKNQIHNQFRGTMVTYTSEAFFEIVVNEQRNELGRLLVEVDERLEGLGT